MNRNLLGVFLLVFFASCDQNSVDLADAPQNPFFDLKAYFENEMKVERSGITKTTTFDGVTETTTLDEIDLRKELKIFSDANLNKVSWYEKYKITTEQVNKGVSKTTYFTEDTRLKTKSVSIFKNNETIDSILIHNEMTSMILDADQFLKYYPGVGYSIRIEQEGRLQEVSDMEIKVRY